MRKVITLGVVSLVAAGGLVFAAAGPTHCAYATVGIGIVQPVCHR